VHADITRLELRLRRRSTIGYAAGLALYTLVVVASLAAASYLVSSLASTISSIRPGLYLSLFYWSVGNNQISKGVSAGDFGVLLLVGACALLAAVATSRDPPAAVA
jgi:ABC-2 type transport system permease protein